MLDTQSSPSKDGLKVQEDDNTILHCLTLRFEQLDYEHQTIQASSGYTYTLRTQRTLRGE